MERSDTVTPTTTRHATTDAAWRDVREGYGVYDIGDDTALTIASWWQSSGTVGHVLASLASGLPVDVTELLDDIAATRRGADVAHDMPDGMALDMLATWAINHPSRTDGPHVDYPHTPGYLYDCPACEARCHCEPGAAPCVWSGHDDTDPTSWGVDFH